jgi:hypothetical protein
VTFDEVVACLALSGLADARTAYHTSSQDSWDGQAATRDRSVGKTDFPPIPVVSCTTTSARYCIHSLGAEVGEGYRGIIPRHATSTALIVELGVDALRINMSTVSSHASGTRAHKPQATRLTPHASLTSKASAEPPGTLQAFRPSGQIPAFCLMSASWIALRRVIPPVGTLWPPKK